MTPDQLQQVLDHEMIKFFVILFSAYIIYWFINKISYRGDK